MRGRPLSEVFGRAVGNSVREHSAASRLTNSTWIELLSACVQLTAKQMAMSLHRVVDEGKYVRGPRDFHTSDGKPFRLVTFAERCQQSSCPQFVPSAMVSSSPDAEVR